MIIQELYLRDYDWVVKVYYVENAYPIELILDDLIALDCEFLDDVLDLMKSEDKNSGFTYSNKKHTILVIGPVDNVSEFANTFDHEKGHLVTHICLFYNIDPYGEEKQYLAGKISEELFLVAKKFLCNAC